MFERMTEWLSSLGLPGVFAGVFCEAIGLPFPGSVLIALAGFMAKQGQFTIIMAGLVSLLGYLGGSISAFMIGRYIGEPFIKRWGRYFRLTPKRLNQAQKLLQKSAAAYVIGGRFVPTIGNITPYVAGISGISIVKFLFYDMVHAVIWLTIFLGAGTLLGGKWQSFTDKPWLEWIAIGGSVLMLAYVFRDLFFTRSRNRI